MIIIMNMTSRVTAIFYCIVGVVYFLIFAMDMEIDRDYFTWVWLLSAELNFMISLRYFIKYDREKIKEEKNKKIE